MYIHTLYYILYMRFTNIPVQSPLQLPKGLFRLGPGVLYFVYHFLNHGDDHKSLLTTFTAFRVPIAFDTFVAELGALSPEQMCEAVAGTL